MSKEPKPAEQSKKVKTLEGLSKLGPTLDELLNAIQTGIVEGVVEISQDKDGAAIRAHKKSMMPHKPSGLTEDEYRDYIQAILGISVDFILGVEDEHATLTKVLDLPDSLEETLRHIYESFKANNVLDHVAYCISSTSPSIEIASLGSVTGTVRLEEPLNRWYSVANLAFLLNIQGEVHPVTLQMDRFEISRLIKKLSDSLEEMDKFKQS